MVVLFALVGGVISAKVVQFTNASKWLKIWALTLIFAILLIGRMHPLTLWIGCILGGLSYGILETSIRTHFMSHFSPKNAGKNFGVLAMIERTSWTIWPLLWILPFSFIGNEYIAYLFAAFLMILLSLGALGILWKRNE